MIKKLKITVLGVTYDVEVEEVEETVSESHEAPQPVDSSKAQPYTKPVIEIKSPIAGITYSVNVKPGDEVKSGDTLCVIELAKIKNSIPAPMTGIINTVNVKASDKVEIGDLLITMTE